ncbi:MAG: tetratricopeptide repeat protein [Flavobacteriales bacterium]|nr:tetratricopeptide repeat protein [Flavobacteriales bacterium]
MHLCRSPKEPFGTVRPADSASIRDALKATYPIESTDPDAAMARYDSLYEVSMSKGFYEGAARAMAYKGIMYNDAGRYSEALDLYRPALPLMKKSNDPPGMAIIHNNMGVSFNLMGDLDSAAARYLMALSVYETERDTAYQISTLGTTGGIFMELEQFIKDSVYFEKALDLALGYGDSTRIADCLIKRGYNAKSREKFESAESDYSRALEIGQNLGNSYVTCLAANNLADLYYLLGRKERVVEFSRKSLQSARSSENPFYALHASGNLGVCLVEAGRADTAVAILDSVISMADELGQKQLVSTSHLYLSEAYGKTGRFAEAYEQSCMHMSAAKELRNESSDALIGELETKYRTAQKDREIADLELSVAPWAAKTSRQQTWLIVADAASAVLILLVIALYTNSKNNERLHKKRMLRTEQEVAVDLLKARIEGEERERKRMARELHVGIGGRLTVIRSQMRNGTDQGSLADALRKTDTEVRRIAHKLMPEILMRRGLKTALTSFVEQRDGHPSAVSLQFLGDDSKVVHETSQAVYRVMQELVKNAVKHVSPKQVAVDETEIHLTVEDDGKGMPYKAGEGAGWINIRERVSIIGGSVGIDSRPDNGTSVTAVFPKLHPIL